ncbi:hypothetical protein [Cognaticolwellia beringensis]|uniref:Uncharacterized protein n=1 Tax=Cognaticolwellia beringensis TaxID=1967665 RepID=A0A222G6J2_9GAMM|nr:hypothetical protein [Cognaticolwellia beringensis]ASP47518.1 hypothetical protein B5D82_06980 [Cognaticolwellia beringensis]
MKLNRMMSVLLVTIIIFTISACGSVSVSNRGTKVTVESKPKQPNVIVNENLSEHISDQGKKEGER